VNAVGLGLPSLADVDWRKWEFIQVVNFAQNNLAQVPHDMVHLCNMVSMNFSRNQLVEFPSVAESPALILDLSRNKLTHPPASMNGMHHSNLVTLNLACNQLRFLAAEWFQGVPRLQNLFLHNNFLETLPLSLSGLQFLGRLTIHGNEKLDYSWMSGHDRIINALQLVFEEAVRKGDVLAMHQTLSVALVNVNRMNPVSQSLQTMGRKLNAVNSEDKPLSSS